MCLLRFLQVDQLWMGQWWFFLWEGRPSLWVCCTWPDSSTWRSWSIWGRQIEGRGLRDGETRPGCCTTTMCLLTHCSSYVNFWWSTRWLHAPTILLSGFGPCRLCFVPKVEIYSAISQFQTIEEIEENLIQDLHALPQNTFQNWKKCWNLCIDSRGEYFEGDKFSFLLDRLCTLGMCSVAPFILLSCGLCYGHGNFCCAVVIRCNILTVTTPQFNKFWSVKKCIIESGKYSIYTKFQVSVCIYVCAVSFKHC
jgi:hypothetical protein